MLKKLKNSKFFSLLLLLLLLVGVTSGLQLTENNQDARRKAAVPEGVAQVFITPESKTIEVGETFQTSVVFDTAGNPSSGLTLKMKYTFTGDQPPISATDISVNSDLVTTGLWDFPYKNIYISGNNVFIELSGLNTSLDGYITQGQENLATITFQGNYIGTISVSFDANETIIASKTTESDILLTPISTGTYTVSENAPTPTSRPCPWWFKRWGICSQTQTPEPTRQPSTPKPTICPWWQKWRGGC